MAAETRKGGRTRFGRRFMFGRRFGRSKNHTDLACTDKGVEATPAMKQMYYNISPAKPRATKAHNANITPPTTPQKNHIDKGVEATPAMKQMYYNISPTKPRATKAHNANITPPTTPQTTPSTPMAFSVTSSHGNGTTTPPWQETDAEKKHRCMSQLHNLARGHKKSLTQNSLLDEEDEHIPVQSTSGHIISNAVFGVVNPCMCMDLVKDSVKGIMSYAADLKDWNEGQGSISLFDCNGHDAGFCGRGLRNNSNEEESLGCSEDDGTLATLSTDNSPNFTYRSRSRGSYHEEDEESSGCSEDAGTLASVSTDTSPNSLFNNDVSVDTTDTESEEESLATIMNRLSMESDYAAAAPAAAPPRVKRVASMASRPSYDSDDLGITSFRIMPNARSNSMSPERGSSAEVISTNMVIDMIAPISHLDPAIRLCNGWRPSIDTNKN